MSTSLISFGYSTARRLASDLTRRGSSESIDCLQQRVDNNACALLREATRQGSALRRFLVITQRCVAPEVRTSELRLLCEDALLRNALSRPVPAYSLVPMHASAR
jgi:hypothetical protein